MNDLQIAAGLANASRNAQRARELAAAQLDEAIKASSHAREAADAAKESARAEQARLTLEQQRFEAEQEERANHREAQKRQTKARELLANAIVEFGEIAFSYKQSNSSGGLGLDLHRKFAVVQARLEILESAKGELVELSDLTEFRKITTQAAKFVAEQSTGNSHTFNPVGDAKRELEQLHSLVARGAALYLSYSEFGLRLFDPNSFPISFLDLTNFSQELQGLHDTLNARLVELRETCKLSLWSAGGLPDKELMILNTLVSVDATGIVNGDSKKGDSESFADRCVEWRLFSEGKGSRYATLLSHLEHVRARIEELQRNGEYDRGRYIESLTAVMQGNYQTAARLLTECRKEVIDDNYIACVKEISACEKKITDCQQAEIMVRLKSPQASKAQQIALSEARMWIYSQRTKIGESDQNECNAAFLAVFAEHTKTIDSRAELLVQQGKDRAIQSILTIFAAVAIIGLLSAFVIMTRNDTVARKAAIVPAQTEEPARHQELSVQKSPTQSPTPDTSITQRAPARGALPSGSTVYGLRDISIKLDLGIIDLPSGIRYNVIRTNDDATIHVKADSDDFLRHATLNDRYIWIHSRQELETDEPLTFFSEPVPSESNKETDNLRQVVSQNTVQQVDSSSQNDQQMESAKQSEEIHKAELAEQAKQLARNAQVREDEDWQERRKAEQAKHSEDRIERRKAELPVQAQEAEDQEDANGIERTRDKLLQVRYPDDNVFIRGVRSVFLHTEEGDFTFARGTFYRFLKWDGDDKIIVEPWASIEYRANGDFAHDLGSARSAFPGGIRLPLNWVTSRGADFDPPKTP